MSIVFKNECASCIDTPLENKTTMYVDKDDGVVKLKDNNENINCLVCNTNLSTYAQCTDVPTDNNQLSNGCGYFKGYGWIPFNCSLYNHSSFVSPASGLLVGGHVEYDDDNHWILDYTINCKYIFPQHGGLVMPVVAGHCYCSGGGQSNANYSILSGIITFSC